MKQNELKIEWVKKAGKQCLKFTFGDNLTEADAEYGIKKWRDCFNSKSGESVTLIWDCKVMTGYNSAARNQWTDALKEMKPQIDTIWLITESSIIKMGASVMGMLSSFDIKVVKSESEINQ